MAKSGLRGIVVSNQPDFLATYMNEPGVDFLKEFTWEIASFDEENFAHPYAIALFDFLKIEDVDRYEMVLH
jgi:hypothetical protein